MDTTITKEEAKAEHERVLKAAMEHVWASEQEFINAIACFYAFENMGKTLTPRYTRGTRAGREHHVFETSWNAEMNDMSMDMPEDDPEFEEFDPDSERREWLKDGKKIVATLKRHTMAFTMANAEDVFKNPKKYEGKPKKATAKKAKK